MKRRPGWTRLSHGGGGRLPLFGVPTNRLHDCPALFLVDISPHRTASIVVRRTLSQLAAAQPCIGCFSKQNIHSFPRWSLAHTRPSTPTPTAPQVPDARLVPGFDRLAPNMSMLMAEGTAQISDPFHAAFYNLPFSELFSKVGFGRQVVV